MSIQATKRGASGEVFQFQGEGGSEAVGKIRGSGTTLGETPMRSLQRLLGQPQAVASRATSNLLPRGAWKKKRRNPEGVGLGWVLLLAGAPASTNPQLLPVATRLTITHHTTIPDAERASHHQQDHHLMEMQRQKVSVGESRW